MFRGDKRRLRTRWYFIGASTLLLLALFLPPLINLGRYQKRIAATLGHSIGRPVHMASIELRLLPLPSFDISDFEVEEDPHFGAEPTLRAPEVIAYLRLSSLWRGRLEVARIDFEEASLNLVRAPDGSWNFASILLQAARTSSAPTAQRRPGGAPRFPYIEASDARINFKKGSEKAPFSFLNSDLSVWLEDSNQWGLHFRAQPVRTDLDLDLADTGILRVDGTFKRAATLSQMPLRLHAQWSAAPLGQLSRLILGRDIGWRGAVEAQADITGPADFAQVKAKLGVEGFRRAEFNAAPPLNLETACAASYRRASQSLGDILCSSAIGPGKLTLSGLVQEGSPRAKADLALDIQRTPVSAVSLAIQELRATWGNAVRPVGELNGHFEFHLEGERLLHAAGEAEASSLVLISMESGRKFTLGPVQVFVDQRDEQAAASSSSSDSLSPVLRLQPVRFSLGGPAPIALDGQFKSSGYALHLSGSGALAQLASLNAAFSWPGAQPAWTGIAVARLGKRGVAVFDLKFAGPWLLPADETDLPPAASSVQGAVVLKGAELSVPGLPQPLHILSARGEIRPAEVAWSDASLSYGSSQFQGALRYPRVCISLDGCTGSFELATPSIDGDALAANFQTAKGGGELLRQLLNRIDRRSIEWPPLSGTLEVGDLSFKHILAHDVVAEVALAGNTLKIRSLDGHLMDGTIHLSGVVKTGGDEPEYELAAKMEGFSPASIARILGEHWGHGAADLSAEWTMAGTNFGDLSRTASGQMSWNWKDGALSANDRTTGAVALRFDDWRGDGAFRNSSIDIQRSALTRGAETIPLLGTISFTRTLSLKSASDSRSMTVTGTLEHPNIRMPVTQAEVQR